MTRADDLYAELLQLRRRAALLSSCGAVLNWDRETYMPAGGAAHRAAQLSLLAGAAHEWSTSPRIGELLELLRDAPVTTADSAEVEATLREIQRTYRRATCLPQRLVEELARVTALAQHHWADARSKKSFALFEPWLNQIVSLKREEAEAVGFSDEGEPYDALLDEYEPGASSASVAIIFDQLRQELVPLVNAVRGSTRRPPVDILHRSYPVAAQAQFAHEAARKIGFDFHCGRMDVTTHPFCSGFGPGDCRLTTRYDEHFFSSAFFGTLHEAGHGMYEQGLRPDAFGTPLGSAVSLGIHESQSRLWENLVGRSESFWTYFFPQAQAAFPAALQHVALPQFLFAINAVGASFIRVEADEVTYNLHIMLRFELERDLISGKLETADVPQAWNQRFHRDFGLLPEHDAQGCLQDIHWSAGLFGYFPTYALGNMYAAQLFEAASLQLGDLDALFARGEFRALLQWLRQGVHGHGQKYPAGELIQRVTGQALSDEPLVRHLRTRFSSLYGI